MILNYIKIKLLFCYGDFMYMVKLNFEEYMYAKETLKHSIFEKLNAYGSECVGTEEFDILIDINKLIDLKLESKTLRFGSN